MTRTSWQATAACGCQTEALGEEEKDKTVVKEGMLDLTDDRKSCFQWLYEVLMVEHSVVWSMQSVFGWGFVRGLMDNKVAQLARRRSGWWLKECWRKRDWEWVCGERGERGWDRLADYCSQRKTPEFLRTANGSRDDREMSVWVTRTAGERLEL